MTTNAMIERKLKKSDRKSLFHIRVDTSDVKAIDEVFKNNSYQRKDFRIEPGEKWLDLGSNVGSFSVFAMASGCVGVRAYEASDVNAEITRRNLQTNGVVRAEVVRAAVMPNAHKADTVTFYMFDRPLALRRHSVFKPKKGGTPVTVPAVSIRDVTARGVADGFTCAKWNIEGCEIEILSSSDFSNSIQGLDKLVLEWSFDKDNKLSTFWRAISHLRTVFTYVDWNKKISAESLTWDFYPPNIFIYCKK